MEIKLWPKIGRVRILSKKHGRRFALQKFINPTGGKKEEFAFFSGEVNSVIIFPFTKDKKVIAIKQFRHAAGGIFIELPGGNKEVEEPLARTAGRELLEETGFGFEKMVKLKADKIWVEPSGYDNYYIPFLATGCYQKSKPKLDPTECIETVTISIDEWLDMISRGEITDCKTLAITFLVLPHIGVEIKKPRIGA